MPIQTRSMTLKKQNTENIIMEITEEKKYNQQTGKFTFHNQKRGSGVYEGEFCRINNVLNPHGYGKCIWNGEDSMGGTYEGEWEAGEMCGKGKMTYENGDIYRGEWEKGEKNGAGKMIYENGDVYDGDWINDNKEGSGKMTYDNSNI